MISENDPERGPFVVETELELLFAIAQAPAGLTATDGMPLPSIGQCVATRFRKKQAYALSGLPSVIRLEYKRFTVAPYCYVCNSFHNDVAPTLVQAP